MYLILNGTSTQIEIQELKDVMALLYSATPFLKMPFHKAIILRGVYIFFRDCIITTFALKFKFWIQIFIELKVLGFLKSVAHINVSLEWIKSISEQI